MAVGFAALPPYDDREGSRVGHAEQLLAILEREERRQAAEEERRLAVARLRRPLRDVLELADATLQHTAFLMRRAEHWYGYFGRTARHDR